MIRLLPAHLLRRHITNRPHQHAGIGESFLRGRVGVNYAGLRRAQFCQSEVENLHAPVFSDKQILRLQVTMHDAFLVCGGESRSDLLCALKRSARQ